MSDLCAPVYIVMGAEEETTFWCFVGIMERMVRFNLIFVVVLLTAGLFIVTET